MEAVLLHIKCLFLRSVNESLQVMMDRCDAKTKQVQEHLETNECLQDMNSVSIY